VKFKEYQVMDFSGKGPFIFIGENCTGKSSVFEGIRRCLKLEYSTSISSVFDENFPSYFICNFETGMSGSNENIISGIVRLPLTNRCKNESDEIMLKVQSSNEKLENEDVQDDQKRKQTEPDLSTDMKSTSQQLKRQRTSSGDNPLNIPGPAAKIDVELQKTSFGEDVKGRNDLESANYYKFVFR
jgi:predicted ATP-binding protein involved in virulence